MKDNLSTPNGKPLRQIKSFAKRIGRITKSQKFAIENYWDDYGIEFSNSHLLFKEIFLNNNPVVLEIGFGMGDSLIKMAKENPKINYLGVEVHTPGIGNLLLKAHLEKLNNIKVIEHDAVEVLALMIEDNSLAGMQVFFPDPWHKSRHHKRRLIQEKFINLVSNKIIKTGFLHIATDWQHYAEQVLHVLLEAKHFKNKYDGYSPRPASRPFTKFEKRGKRLDHGVWDIFFIRQ
jgi:tRNA (guanine-N7-)-methyltransferase